MLKTLLSIPLQFESLSKHPSQAPLFPDNSEFFTYYYFKIKAFLNSH